MKIKIAEEYLNLDEDFTIVVDDYSKEAVDEELDGKFIQSNEYYNSDNNHYEEEENNEFKVEIQYLEEDVPNNIHEVSNNYNSSQNTTNYDGENYKGLINDKYKEYDKFCHNQEINYNYDSNIIYDEPLNSEFESEKNVEDNKYKDCNSEKEVGFMDECNYEEDSKNREFFGFTQELDEMKINTKPNNGSVYEECEVDYSCSNNKVEDYNNSSQNYYENNFEDCYGDNYVNNYKVTKGEIKVSVKLGDKNGIEIKGAKINLYELNGVCPKLYESRLTDCNGEITFDNLEDGCYRVISIVDRRFFEKPQYISWNEVTIDSFIKSANICVINRLKPSCLKR